MDKSPISIGGRERQSSCPRGSHINPLLNAEEEHALCLQWRDRHDITAAHRLVESHLRMVIEITRDFRRNGLNMDDLIGEGYVGLMRAICRFDPDNGALFSAYARRCIISAIREYILSHRSVDEIGTPRSEHVGSPPARGSWQSPRLQESRA